MSRFVDNVIMQVVERHLIQRGYIRKLDEQQAQALVGENAEVQRGREQLQALKTSSDLLL